MNNNFLIAELTQKELYVLTEVLKGKSNQEISKTFFVTLHTVKAHIQSILYKTRSKHRAELISKFFTYTFDFEININSVENVLKNKLYC